MFFLSSVIVTCVSLLGGTRLFNMCCEPNNNYNSEEDDSIENEFNEFNEFYKFDEIDEIDENNDDNKKDFFNNYPIYDIIDDGNNSPDYQKKNNVIH